MDDEIVKTHVRIYLLHKIGLVLGSVAVLIWLSFFIENPRILDEPFGRGLFFLSPGLVLATGPLIFGLSRQDSLRFLFFELSLFGTYGVLALALPADVLPRSISILTIVVLVLLIVLKRSHRDLHILDMKSGITSSIFIESMSIFAVASAIAFLLRSQGATFATVGTFSDITTYLLLWAIIFVVLSLAAIPVRIIRNRSLNN